MSATGTAMHIDHNEDKELLEIAVRYENDSKKQEEAVKEMSHRLPERTAAYKVFRALCPLVEENSRTDG